MTTDNHGNGFSTGLLPVQVCYLNRDADQSLIGGRERTERNAVKLRLASESGFPLVEMGGGARTEVSARFKNEHPYNDALDRLAEASSDMERQILFRGQAGNGRRIHSDPTIRMAMDVLTRNGKVDRIRAFDATNNLQNLQTVIDTHKELRAQGRDSVLQLAMAYSKSQQHPDDPEGWVYRDVNFYIDLAEKYIAAGADELCIKDMAGTLEPEDAEALIATIKARHPQVLVALHMHAASGKAQDVLLKASKAGVDVVDVGVEGMADWVGHVTVQDYIWLMKNSGDPVLEGRCPELNEEPLERLTQHNLESRVLHHKFELAYDREIQQAVIAAKLPGGMATTFVDSLRGLYRKEIESKRFKFVSQAKERLGEAFTPAKETEAVNEAVRLYPDVTSEELKRATLGALKLVPKVNRDLGHVELVTPTSDIVGKQALHNFFYSERGGQPYQVLGPGFADYVLGKLGYSQNKPREEIIRMVEKKTGQKRYEGRPADLTDPQEVSKAQAKLEDLGIPADDENVLTALFTGDDKVGYAFLCKYYDTPAEKWAGFINPYKPEDLPSFPDYLPRQAAADSGDSVKRIQDVRRALGAVFIEGMVQKAQKLQMIYDGTSFVGISDKLKSAYTNKLKASIRSDLQSVNSRLLATGFDANQALAAIFNQGPLIGSIHKDVARRAAELGVRREFIPVISMNGAYHPPEHEVKTPEVVAEPTVSAAKLSRLVTDGNAKTLGAFSGAVFDHPKPNGHDHEEEGLMDLILGVPPDEAAPPAPAA